MASNWNKADAYVNGPADYEEIPELTDADFARGTIMMNGQPLKRGSGEAKHEGATRLVTLQLDTVVVEEFLATGPEWQARINEALREWLARRAA